MKQTAQNINTNTDANLKKLNNSSQNLLNKFLKQRQSSSLYLDYNLNGEYKILPKISAIIPTYNRSPHTAKEDANPLGWCLESLINQEKGNLDEIIVIDDNSTDHTLEIVNYFANQTNIPIKYLKNKKQLGSSISRNNGVNMSRNNLVFFMDDDCIASKYMLFGANYTLSNLNEDTSIVQLPVYHRKIIPEIDTIENIGILDFESGDLKGNWNKFPKEYLENDKEIYSDSKLGIMKPFEVDHTCGVFLMKKQDYQDINGFPEFFTWNNGYREETHLALKLRKKGKKMFFIPDPKFYCVHLRYGARSPDPITKIDNEPKLNKRISMSNTSFEESGNRVVPKEWFNDYILATHFTLSCMNSQAAENFRKRMWNEFVIHNKLSVSGVNQKLNASKQRERIFNSAMNESRTLLNKHSY